ncbi:hypothetical protein [Prevotella ihumii]|nr:hypothetical protein [Prevotella ihumii]
MSDRSDRSDESDKSDRSDQSTDSNVQQNCTPLPTEGVGEATYP